MARVLFEGMTLHELAIPLFDGGVGCWTSSLRWTLTRVSPGRSLVLRVCPSSNRGTAMFILSLSSSDALPVSVPAPSTEPSSTSSAAAAPSASGRSIGGGAGKESSSASDDSEVCYAIVVEGPVYQEFLCVGVLDVSRVTIPRCYTALVASRRRPLLRNAPALQMVESESVPTGGPHALSIGFGAKSRPQSGIEVRCTLLA